MKREYNLCKLRKRPGMVKIDPDAAKTPISIRLDGTVLADLRSEAERLGSDSAIKPFPMRPRIVEADFPEWEDLSCEYPPDLVDNYHELFQNVSGFKFGGWPTLIQSEIFWSPGNEHPIAPEYVFQIDSNEKANWM
jgi:hypothetical protein